MALENLRRRLGLLPPPAVPKDAATELARAAAKERGSELTEPFLVNAQGNHWVIRDNADAMCSYAVVSVSMDTGEVGEIRTLGRRPSDGVDRRPDAR